MPLPRLPEEHQCEGQFGGGRRDLSLWEGSPKVKPSEAQSVEVLLPQLQPFLLREKSMEGAEAAAPG
jgi:hypothetical protein